MIAELLTHKTKIHLPFSLNSFRNTYTFFFLFLNKTQHSYAAVIVIIKIKPKHYRVFIVIHICCVWPGLPLEISSPRYTILWLIGRIWSGGATLYRVVFLNFIFQSGKSDVGAGNSLLKLFLSECRSQWNFQDIFR